MGLRGLPWWPSGWDSRLPSQEVRVQSLVRELRSHWLGSSFFFLIKLTWSKKKLKYKLKRKMDSETCLCGARIQNQFSYGTQRVDNWLRDSHQLWACPRPCPILCFFQQLGWRRKRHVIDSAESSCEHAPMLRVVPAWFLIPSAILQGTNYHHFHFR